LGVQAGERVLVPDLTWPSPAHAVLELGALPVLVDVDEHEWNITPRSLAATDAALLRGLRAAIIIDQFGNPARVRELERQLPGIPLLVDAACSLGSQIGPDACGALGVVACLSFHPRKLLTTAEGGMCLSDDAELAQRIRELRNHGQHSPGQFVRASGNYRLSEPAAALGLVQLSRLSGMVQARSALAARYAAALRELAPGGLAVQVSAPDARPNYQTFGVLLPEGCARERVVAGLRAREVEAGRLSYALHALPQFARLAPGSHDQRFAQASALAERGLALPLWPGLPASDQARVIDALQQVLRQSQGR